MRPHRQPEPLLAMVVTLGLAVATATSPARADEYDAFALAKNAFDAGEYAEAVKRFDALLQAGLQNPSLIVETHKLIAISYLFTGNEAMAESHFTKLLIRSPDFTLDPLLYPIEVVDFFTKVKQKSKRQLEALARAKAIEAEKQREADEARQRLEAERRKRNVYIEREVYRGSLLVAALPFGAGQFQNGHRLKGYLFLSAEVLLVGGSIASYFLHAGLRDDAKTPFTDPELKERYILREKVYRIANFATVGTLAGVLIAGLVDGLLGYRAETVVWKKVRPEAVPDHLKPKAEKRPSVSVQMTVGGIAVLGYF